MISLMIRSMSSPITGVSGAKAFRDIVPSSGTAVKRRHKAEMRAFRRGLTPKVLTFSAEHRITAAGVWVIRGTHRRSASPGKPQTHLSKPAFVGTMPSASLARRTVAPFVANRL